MGVSDGVSHGVSVPGALRARHRSVQKDAQGNASTPESGARRASSEQLLLSYPAEVRK